MVCTIVGLQWRIKGLTKGEAKGGPYLVTKKYGNIQNILAKGGGHGKVSPVNLLLHNTSPVACFFTLPDL